LNIFSKLPPVLIKKIKLGALLLLPPGLFLLPLSYMESMPSVCLIKNITGYECPGCGMTHSVFNILHGNFIQAFYYNKLVIVIFPLLAYIWLKTIVVSYKSLASDFKTKNQI
jgi:Protein of unknown function (DUF2752)